MPQQLFYANTGLIVQGTAMRTALEPGKLRLFKSGFTPGIATTLAELEAEEADYTGYTPDGVEVAELSGPFLAPEGGVAIQSPAVVFTTSSPVVTPNLIGGYWFEDGSGKPIVIAQFAEAQPMQVPYQSITIQIRLVFPN